jgi:hypothetical protein
MAQITDAKHPTLASLIRALGPSADCVTTDRFAVEVEDDIEGEQEALMPGPADASEGSEGPSQISNILATVGEVSMAVKDATDADYRW